MTSSVYSDDVIKRVKVSSIYLFKQQNQTGFSRYLQGDATRYAILNDIMCWIFHHFNHKHKNAWHTLIISLRMIHVNIMNKNEKRNLNKYLLLCF